MAEELIIHRHKTAIRRSGYSLPVKCLLRDGLLDSSRTFFDYGCGRGLDLDLLRDIGIDCEGWDPAHRPHGSKQQAEVVNLGYVINVIEDPQERAKALRGAWTLCQDLLVVAAQLTFDAPATTLTRYRDGVLTSRGTFQKYFGQAELRGYLETQLGTDAVPAAPGVFYLFKSEERKQQFLANRYRRIAVAPVRRILELLYEQNRELLDPLLAVFAKLGRVPAEDEVEQAGEIVARLGSIKRAIGIIQRVTETSQWQTIAKRRAEDLQVYLALTRFHRRPQFAQLPLGTQRDVKAFFGTYQSACQQADTLLFSTGNAKTIDTACQRSQAGLLVENALLVHRSVLSDLEPLLRVYEGCARALVGEVEEANVIKLHRHSGKVSYLAYPEFETDPHPTLAFRIKAALRTLDIDYFDYVGRANCPVLARKEALISSEHPLHGRFASLTRQEIRQGLDLTNPTVLTQQALDQWLRDNHLVLRGHRLLKAT